MDEGKEEATDQVVNLTSSLIPATRDREGNRERERKGVKTDENSKETTLPSKSLRRTSGYAFDVSIIFSSDFLRIRYTFDFLRASSVDCSRNE